MRAQLASGAASGGRGPGHVVGQRGPAAPLRADVRELKWDGMRGWRRVAEHRSIKDIRSSDHSNCAMRAWHSMSRYGARYPLVAAYCMLHVLTLILAVRLWGAVAGRSLLFFSSCRMSAHDRKELLQTSDEDCSRASGSPFAFHTPHVTGPARGARSAMHRAFAPRRIGRTHRTHVVTDPSDRATVAAGTPDL